MADYSLLQWFDSLLIYEKSIVLTIVDQELVDLVKSLHKDYNINGKPSWFSPANLGPHTGYLQEKGGKVKGYELIFSISQDLSGYENSSGDLQQFQQALIDTLRVININGKEALTLDSSMLKNTTFFKHICNGIDSGFLGSPIKMEKCEAKEALCDSVLQKSYEKADI